MWFYILVLEELKVIVSEVLKDGKEKLIENKVEDASIIARVLLQYVLKLNREELILKHDDEIEKNDVEKYFSSIEKIIDGVPLQYITNNQEFYGLNFYVDENVLIPQPDTEILVEEAIKIIKNEKKDKVLDMCTGSGCVGISIAKNTYNIEVTLCDISEEALKVAKGNINKNITIEDDVSKRIKTVKTDLFEKINEKFDVIVSNPPYIKTSVISMLSKQVRNEPILALDGGKDGLEFYKKIIKDAPNFLNENGYILLEIGYDQKEKVIKLAQDMKIFSKIEAKQDLSGNDRVVVLRK